MTKHSKRQIKKRKYTRKIYGGNPFTDDEITYLRENHFTKKNIEYLERRKQNRVIPISLIRNFINRGYSAKKIIEDMEEGEDTDVESDIESQGSQYGGSKRTKRNRTTRKSLIK